MGWLARVSKRVSHCTERALEPGSPDQWAGVFSAAGLSLEVERVGCCGMSGAYGHEVCHQEESRGIFEMSWRHHLPADPTRALVTGHSCRHQVHRFADASLRHPVQVLAEHVAKGTSRT